MPVLKVYPNGLTMGTGNPSPTGGIRSKVSGWSASATRRLVRWLYSVQVPLLTGTGYAVTLTVKDCPPSSAEWASARRDWIKRVQRIQGTFLRLHWLTEWQKRKVPHMHCAVYFEDAITKELLIFAWLQVCLARGWVASWNSQDVKEMDGALGWLKYQAKHSSRGVRHYQRQGKPPGWETTGRLWGYVGDWPLALPLEANLTRDQQFRLRRLMRSRAIADARASQNWKRLAIMRRSLKCSDRVMSQVRGISHWVDQEQTLRLLDLVEDLPGNGSEGS